MEPARLDLPPLIGLDVRGDAPIDDEGPSPEDIARFSDETGYCPECGAEVWDLAPACPRCGSVLSDGPSSRPPVDHHLKKKWVVLVVVLLVLLLVPGLLGLLRMIL